jgi:hypothetical protein
MNSQLRLLQPTKPRLGLYLRPGRNDHTVFNALLAEDRAVSGLVLDARNLERHRQLRENLIGNGVHAVLDTDFMEMSTTGGAVLAGLDTLPWRRFAQATASQLRGQAGRDLAATIADSVATLDFSAVLAPTHLLADARDPFFGADRTVTAYLRTELDRRGLRETPIFYPLALPAASLRDGVQLSLILDSLRSLDLDAVWLRLHPFGATAGPLALRHYIETGWQLGQLGLPIVGERTGTIGLALMAFGAVGGIESGITFGERFDAQALNRPRDPRGGGYIPQPRVYLHEIGAFVSRAVARRLFQNRQMIASLGCRDGSCCREGVDSMIRDPRRHFVIRRAGEVERIGGVAPDARGTMYVNDVVRRGAVLSGPAARVAPELVPVQRRLERWHGTLEALLRQSQRPAPIPAVGQRIRTARPKPYSVE